jgi:hypothetical protein
VTVLSDTAIRGKDLDDEKANAAKAAAEEASKGAIAKSDCANRKEVSQSPGWPRNPALHGASHRHLMQAVGGPGHGKRQFVGSGCVRAGK